MATVTRRPGSAVRDVLRAVSWHRRLLAAGLAAASVAVALHLLEPRPAPTTSVLAAAHDLPAGVHLTPSDVREIDLPSALVPAGALTARDPVGARMLAAPVRSGETLTDVRMLGPDLLAAQNDRAGGVRSEPLVAAPVRIADPGALSVVRVGDQIDVLAAETDETQVHTTARTVVGAARILALPGAGDHGGRASGLAGGALAGGSAEGVDGLGTASTAPGAVGADGGLVVLAVTRDVAAELARAAVTARLSLVLRSPS